MDLVLVHGAYHGAWCWDRLLPELDRLGHRGIAVDLPIDDPGAGLDAYADVVAAAVPEGVEPVVVGHSMGGLVAPMVASRRVIRGLIFLAAFLPIAGRSANDQRASEPLDPPIGLATAEFTDLGDDLWQIGPATATELFFGDAAPDLAAWAVAKLRPQCYRVMSEPSPLKSWPDLPVASIVCRDDHAIDPDWVRSAARTRLGVEAAEIDGAHSPFLTRPGELAAMIDRLLPR